MRLSIRASIITSAVLWGGCILFVGLVNLAAPSYGAGFLKGVSSIYPFFHASGTFGDVLIGTIVALIDGAFGGLLIAWLYNLFVGDSKSQPH